MSRRPVANPKVDRPRDIDMAYPHEVYRIYGTDGQLMYIGCAQSASDRIYMHVAAWHSSWPSMQMFGRMGSYTVAIYPTKLAARAAEREGILKESPLYNRQHNPKRWTRRGGEWRCIDPYEDPALRSERLRAQPERRAS